jgi:hypothetical protein
MKLFHKEKGVTKHSIMNGRDFFAQFLTSFKNFKHKVGQILNLDITGRFCVFGKKGQSVLEYFIIIAFVIAVTAFGVSSFLNHARESSEVIFKKAAERMGGGLSVLIGVCKDDLAGIEDTFCFKRCWEMYPPPDHFTEYQECADNCRSSLALPGWAISGWSAFKQIEIPAEFTDAFAELMADPVEFVGNTYGGPGQIGISMTSARWQQISGLSLAPGSYYYWLGIPGNLEFCFPLGDTVCRDGCRICSSGAGELGWTTDHCFPHAGQARLFVGIEE